MGKIVRIHGRNRNNAGDTMWSKINIAVLSAKQLACVVLEQVLAINSKPPAGTISRLRTFAEVMDGIEGVNDNQRRYYHDTDDLYICDLLDVAEAALAHADWHGASIDYIQAMHQSIAEMRDAASERKAAMRQERDTGTG